MADNYEEYSRDDLLRLLRERDRKPRFGLVWERDEIDHDNSVNNDFIALDYDPELSHGDGPHENLLIEGDNFDALRYLRMTHAGKVKCIYIDPPYNTCNRDFIYNDKFIDKEDLYKHSKWIEYIYRRLILAKDLLTNDGIIFVSINDIEMAHLKLLMDQVFGENNCLANFVWQTDGNFDNQARFKSCHEYIFAYSNNEKLVSSPSVIDPNSKEDSKLFNKEIKNTIVKNGPKNPVSEIHLPAGFPANFEKGIIEERNDKWPHFLSKATVKDYTLQNDVTVKSGWANKNLCELFIKNDFQSVWDTKNQPTNFVLTETGAIENIKTRTDKQSHVISVIKNVGSVQASGDELSSMGLNFPYPKPVGLIKYLISMIDDKDFIVCDFFAGSATTAHAVMSLNSEDSGNRRYIMVSSTEATKEEPDKNVCRDIACKRLSAVINGYSYKIRKVEKLVPGLGGEFAYLKAKHIPVETVFTEIQHNQIWTALQLIHESGFGDYDENASIQIQESNNSFIAYISKLTDEALGTIQEAIKGKTNITLYSWQPALLKQRIDNSSVSFEPIPQFLTDRFGVGG